MSKVYPQQLLLALLFLSSHAVFSQTKIKDGTAGWTNNLPDSAAILDLESVNKGLLLPRVALYHTTTWGLSGSPVAGMLVYNTSPYIYSTDTAYIALPGGSGTYYWDGTGWIGMRYTATPPEPWQVGGTTDRATSNNQNIYQNAYVGIGDFSASGPLARLDVRGAIRGGNPETAAPVGINSIAVGDSLVVTGANSASFGRGNVTIKDNTFLFGIRNRLEQGYLLDGTAIFGTNNRITTDGGGPLMRNNTIFGRNNEMATYGGGPWGADNNTIFGENNLVVFGGIPSSGTFVTGKSNKADLGNNTGEAVAIFGRYNVASQDHQFVAGQANLNVNGSLFEIGNGTDSMNRSNALTVLSDGRTGLGTGAPASTLDINGSVSHAMRTITASTTLTFNDYTILKTGTGAATLTLPAANTCAGRVYRIVEHAKGDGTSTITLSPGVRVGGGLAGTLTETDFYMLYSNGGGAGVSTISCLIQSNGTDWYFIGL